MKTLSYTLPAEAASPSLQGPRPKVAFAELTFAIAETYVDAYGTVIQHRMPPTDPDLLDAIHQIATQRRLARALRRKIRIGFSGSVSTLTVRVRQQHGWRNHRIRAAVAVGTLLGTLISFVVPFIIH